MKVKEITVTAGTQVDYGEKKISVTYTAEVGPDEDVDSCTRALENKAENHVQERKEQWQR